MDIINEKSLNGKSFRLTADENGYGLDLVANEESYTCPSDGSNYNDGDLIYGISECDDLSEVKDATWDLVKKDIITFNDFFELIDRDFFMLNHA